MRQDRPSSRSPRAQRLRKVTVLVPEDCVESIRQFAQELRTRHRGEPAETPLEWQALTPSAELMVDPERRARCSVRDTRAARSDRFLWGVTHLGRFRTIASGRAGDLAEARQLAEAALRTYAEEWRERSGRRNRDD
jgi:hypothetical protein